ncbi:MAG: O-methyltransferase [Acidimicrobiia bacterium]
MADTPSNPARSRSDFVQPHIVEYASAHSSGPDAVQAKLQRETAEKTGGASVMQIGDDQAVLMELVVRAMGAKRAIEVGTFTGYSALAIAKGLGPDGHLLCCDVSEEWTAIARQHWIEAGVSDRIELKIAPALDTLKALPPDPVIDFAFVDADKPAYAAYYDELIPRLRQGGLLLADNTLQSGNVTDAAHTNNNVVAMRAFNANVASDPRVRQVLVPIGDGVTFIQKL